MPPLLTDDQVRDARGRICAIAERQFAERGFPKTSLRSIAGELGWSAASLYRYFRDKEALLAATRAAALERFSERIERAYAEPGDLWERSRALGQAYVDFAFAEPAAYKLMFALDQPSDAAFPDLARAETRSRRTLTSYVEDMVGAGLLEGEPEILSRVYWAALHGLIVLEMAGKLKGSPPFDLLRREAVRLITRGARPDDGRG
ncbi:TetR/AcrR family transcriptional regulator [Chelatococcus reniformis]|uniref:TetR family transcriptional regulator n=1 Tax=Chelatococcus reniformis TaxID=1494448 RepID=A0A916TYL3_9HYPH|nr:TetR/AcrR family transcriptional regulator [Chelatococcus reniformis]GGC52645.1 TetR family transcriptional regulator [Chelatococcus reniformis]